YADSDKARKLVIEEANKADSVCADTEKAMNEFKDQLDKTEKEKVEKLVKELREIAVKGQAGDASVTPEQIKAAIDATQTASLGLFQKVYEKKHAEQKSQETADTNTASEEPKKE
ncbi:70-kilodalton heat shock protein, partial [Tulasnella sp. 427]